MDFTAGEAVGPIAGFGTVAVFGAWIFAAILRRTPGPTADPRVDRRPGGEHSPQSTPGAAS